MENLQLTAEPRSVVGKKVRLLRRDGIIPANVYGQSASTAIQVRVRDSEAILSRAGKTRLITLSTDGADPTTVMVKDYQRHPIKGSLLHIDFYRIAMTQMLKLDIPLRLVGEAPGVRLHDATLLQAASTVSVESLPGNIPEAFEVDLSGLVELDSSVFVRDLVAPEGVTIVTDGEEMIVKLLPPKVAVEVAEAEEAAPAAEVEQPAEAATEGSAE